MAGDTDDKKDPTDSAKDDVDDKKDDDLGDSGKSALDKERKARREAERRAREAEAKVKTAEDADKSAAERLTGVEADLAKEKARADRLQVAIDKGLTAAQAKRLVGDTLDELEADADEILETFGGAKPPDGTPDDDEPKRPPSRKPSDDLRGGLDPGKTPVDVKSLLDSIPPTA